MRAAGRALIVSLSVGCASAGQRGSQAVPSYGVYYRLTVRLDPAQGTIQGDAWIATAPFATIPSERLFAAPALVIDSILSNRVPATVFRRGDTVTFALPSPPSRSGVVQVFYHGRATPPALSMEPHAGTPAASTYGLPYSARSWWPAPGSTLAKADSADVIVTVPTPLTAVSNGRLVSRSTGPDRWVTYHWATRHPIYPDVISIAVGAYAELDDSVQAAERRIPLRFYVFADDSTKARFDFARLPQILAFFSELLGPYPFADEKYGVAEFTTQSFREHQTIPSLGPRFVTGDRRNEWILAHELAHQWFGNSLSVRTWSDAWLNEGLATYAAMLWKEHVAGRAAYDEDIKAARARQFTGALTVADSTDLDHMFGATTFFKGALMLDALRHLLGDDRFFAALKGYVHEHTYGLVAAADFERAMERGCGRPLTAFFKVWLTTESLPSPPGTDASSACPRVVSDTTSMSRATPRLYPAG
ncbi:MAG TPA: M1 family metallopeptidase [Gemmatimonadales bacterium]|nr:M1 family metallopeptidase [Gemmatimonadales bacterium]